MQARDDRHMCGPESTAGFWINRASRLIVRRTDTRLRAFGLATSYLPVLRALAERGPLSQTELARIAGVEQPSMAETIARMERDGVVEREPNPNDRRATLVVLTRLARPRFQKALAALNEGEREATAGLTDHEHELLRGILERVVRNVEAALLGAQAEEPPPTAPSKRSAARRKS